MFKPRYANKSFARLIIPGIATTGFVGGYIYYRAAAAPEQDTGGQAERSRHKRDNEGLGGAGIGGNATSGGHETGMPGSGVQPGTGDVERQVNTDAPKEMLPAGGVGGGHGGGNSNARAVDWTGKKEQRNDISDSMSTVGSSGSSGTNKLPGSNTAKLDSGDSPSSGNTDTTGASSAASSAKPPTRSGARTNNEALSTSDYQVRDQSYPTSKSDHLPNDKTTYTEGTSMSQRLQGMFGQGGSKSSAQGEAQKKFDPKVHSNLADTPTKRHKMRSDS